MKRFYKTIIKLKHLNMKGNVHRLKRFAESSVKKMEQQSINVDSLRVYVQVPRIVSESWVLMCFLFQH